jgi:hypothetical protein
MPYWNHLRRRGRKIICSPPRRWPVRSLVPRVLYLEFSTSFLLPWWLFLCFCWVSSLYSPGECFWAFGCCLCYATQVSIFVFVCAFGCCLCHPTQVSIFVFVCAFGCCLFTALVSVFLRFWVLSLLPWWVFLCFWVLSLYNPGECFLHFWVLSLVP